MNSQTKGYIFRCTSSTEDECFERMLFGETKAMQSWVRLIKPGDKLFLYNGTTRKLHGLFIAKSAGDFEIEPESWGGKYPWQARVEWGKKFNPLSRDEIEQVLKFNGRYSVAVLTEDQIQKLLELFESAKVLPSDEKEFRTKFPQDHRSDDGHWVRSQGELNVDNWFFNQQICHGYERKLPTPENIYCDFFIPIKGTKNYVYVEYWGREDERYQARKKSKIAIYKKYGLPLIELTIEDLENLDDVLPRKLHMYMKDLVIY